jgi:predicted transposase YdaD
MPYYDEIVKHLMDRFPHAFAVLALKTPDVEVQGKLTTEQPTVKIHQSDMTFRVRLRDEEAILHIEAQTEDSRDKPMPLRMLAYASFLGLQYELPVYSTVLYFRPNAGRTDPGYYAYGDESRGGLWYKYTVIRLAELEGASFLDASSIGLLPFTPLMRPPAGMTGEAWIEKCVETTLSARVDSQTRATLLFALSIFGSLAYSPELFQAFISEEIMQESPFYEVVMQRGFERGVEQGIEQGIEQGARETSIANILAVLTARFPQRDPHPVQHALEAILDLDRLTQLLQTAALTPTFEAFLQALDA